MFYLLSIQSFCIFLSYELDIQSNIEIYHLNIRSYRLKGSVALLRRIAHDVGLNTKYPKFRIITHVSKLLSSIQQLCDLGQVIYYFGSFGHFIKIHCTNMIALSYAFKKIHSYKINILSYIL
jgi:hypothetical protein